MIFIILVLIILMFLVYKSNCNISLSERNFVINNGETKLGLNQNIDKKPDALRTLYNLGHKREAHNAPKANHFGEHVKKYYDLMDYIMKEERVLWRYEEVA